MNPLQAIISGFRNYANFEGRASRSEYWWFYGFFVALLLTIFVASLVWQAALFTLWGIYLAAILTPLLAVTVRRLHDLDRPGKWAILALIPFAGIRLTRLLVQPGTPGTNRYGPTRSALSCNAAARDADGHGGPKHSSAPTAARRRRQREADKGLCSLLHFTSGSQSIYNLSSKIPVEEEVSF